MEKDVRKQIKKYQKLRLKAQGKGDLKEESTCLNYLGELHTELGEHEESLNLHNEELGICQAVEDKIGQAVAHRKIGECYAALGKYKKAVQHQQKHLEIAKISHDLPEQQRAYTTIGRTHLDQGTDLHFDGSYDRAKSCFKEAENAFRISIRLARSLQESKSLPEKEICLMKARSSMNLAMVYHYLSMELDENFCGNYAKQSLAFHQKALAISQKHMLSEETHRTHINLVNFYRSHSMEKEAISHCEEAVRCAKVARNTPRKIEALTLLGDVYLWSGNCEASRKTFKKCYRLSNDLDEKDSVKDKLKIVLEILQLQSRLDGSTADQKFEIYEKIADKFADSNCFRAAADNYKMQEELFADVESVTDKQKAAVYFSLGITSSDLNDHETAIEYFMKELEFHSEQKELSKTWTQIGACKEKLSKDLSEIEFCYSKAIEYASEAGGDGKLLLKALSLLLSTQEQRNSSSAAETRQKISEVQTETGILAVEGEEDSEDISGKQQQNEEEQEDEERDDESLVDKELETVSSDDSDAEENRKSRLQSRVWNRKHNAKGETPLHTACIEGHMKRVQLLIEQGHPLNTPDFAGWTPLHESCIHGHADVARLLLEHGAHVNSLAHCGTTPLIDAAVNGHLDVVALLLEKGADASILNNRKDSALSSLELWFSGKEAGELDQEDIESYQKIQSSLKEACSNPKNKENFNPNTDFGALLREKEDLYDAELITQRSQIDQSEGNKTSDSYIIRPTRRNQVRTRALQSDNFPTSSQFPSSSQRIDDFGPDLDDPIFNDNNILPVLDPNEANSMLGGADEYKRALACLGSSDTLAKLSNGLRSQRAPKRPSTDDLGGLIAAEDYVEDDDWLIDDLEDVGENHPEKQKSQPNKRPKTMRTVSQTNLGNYGWKKTNAAKKVNKDTNSGSFTSSFLNRSNIQRKSAPKKLAATKIRDFIPETDSDNITTDNATSCHENVVSHDKFPPPSIPSSSDVHPSGQSINMTTQLPPTPALTMRVKVKINGKMFLIAVPGSNKTVAWLCDRASLVYKQQTGLQPRLFLYAGGSVNEDDACLLSSDDLVCDVLQSNEHVVAKIKSWETIPLSKKYQETCKEAKQAAIPVIVSACEQSTASGRVDLTNLSLPCRHLKSLVTNLMQQEVTSLLLPGNSLCDDGVTTLCEALQKQLTLNSLSNSGTILTELNLRCSNMKQPGLKKLAQAAENGALKDLQILDLSFNRFGDTCLDELKTLIQSLKSLKKLHLKKCRFSHKLFHSNYPLFRSAVQGCVTVTDIDISGNMFGSVGVELFLKSLPHRSITSLNMSSVCDASNNSLIIRHVICYLKQEDCYLQTLHLPNNGLNFPQLSEFVKDLQSIKHLSLRKLDLSTNVTTCPQEIRLLSLLADVPAIEEISIKHGFRCWRLNNRDYVEKKQSKFLDFESNGPLAPQIC